MYVPNQVLFTAAVVALVSSCLYPFLAAKVGAAIVHRALAIPDDFCLSHDAYVDFVDLFTSHLFPSTITYEELLGAVVSSGGTKLSGKIVKHFSRVQTITEFGFPLVGSLAGIFCNDVKTAYIEDGVKTSYLWQAYIEEFSRTVKTLWHKIKDKVAKKGSSKGEQKAIKNHVNSLGNLVCATYEWVDEYLPEAALDSTQSEIPGILKRGIKEAQDLAGLTSKVHLPYGRLLDIRNNGNRIKCRDIGGKKKKMIALI